MAIHVIERSQRQPPALGAIFAIRQQAEVAEENVHVLAVGYRARRRRRIGRLVALQPWTRGLPPPENLAGSAAESQSVQPAALIDYLFPPGVSPRATLGAGDEDEIPCDNGRGKSERR